MPFSQLRLLVYCVTPTGVMLPDPCFPRYPYACRGPANHSWNEGPLRGREAGSWRPVCGNRHLETHNRRLSSAAPGYGKRGDDCGPAPAFSQSGVPSRRHLLTRAAPSTPHFTLSG